MKNHRIQMILHSVGIDILDIRIWAQVHRNKDLVVTCAGITVTLSLVTTLSASGI